MCKVLIEETSIHDGTFRLLQLLCSFVFFLFETLVTRNNDTLKSTTLDVQVGDDFT